MKIQIRDIGFSLLAAKAAVGLISSATAQPASSSAQGQDNTVTPEAAHAIAVEAYLYLYPLVTMDVTRKQSVNIEPGKALGKGPMNMFVSVPAYPPADMKLVVRPNFDTLYSLAWLDLSREPQVVSAPDTGGRYYDSDGYQIANGLNRFAVSSWMPFRTIADGSLDLYFQNENPGPDKEPNWVPAPKGAFNLCMRLYGPKSEALTGKWNPPPVVKTKSPRALQAQ